MTTRGAPKGNQNAAKEGRDAFLHIRTSSAFKGAVNAAAQPGGMSDYIHAALREYIRQNQPEIVERYPEAFDAA